MTLLEMKKKILGLIEELNKDSKVLTDDPDIEAKLIEVMNQVMFELARFKKIPKYVEIEVEEGDVLNFDKLEGKCGSAVYQIVMVSGVDYRFKAQGTAIKILESGTAEIECYVYPERLTEKTNDNYELELSPDVLEIMPYGVAADLLKSDVSAEYGKIYADRYEAMKQVLDPRYNMTSIRIEGGVNI